MPTKSGKPTKRDTAPRVGTVTQEGAENLESKLTALCGSISACRKRMEQKGIEFVKFDGGNVMDRVIRDGFIFLADLEHAIKIKEIQYPGRDG